MSNSAAQERERFESAIAALEWYGDEAKALSVNAAQTRDQAMLATVSVLILDGGRRASDAIALLRQPAEGEQGAEPLREALAALYDVVIAQNRLGASWHREVFDDLMTALGLTEAALSAVSAPLTPSDRDLVLAGLMEDADNYAQTADEVGRSEARPEREALYENLRDALTSVHPAAPSATVEHLTPSDAGADAPSTCKGLDTPERVRFYEHDFYPLSNFSAFTLMWKGQLYDTSEAAYHSEKFAERDLRVRIMHAPSAHEAFKLAEGWKDRRRKDWDAVKVGIMRDILRAKTEQHEYVRRKLLATGDRELVEDSWRDDFWGWGPSRDGQNMLGRLWMEVRAELMGAPTNEEQAMSDGREASRQDEKEDRGEPADPWIGSIPAEESDEEFARQVESMDRGEPAVLPSSPIKGDPAEKSAGPSSGGSTSGLA